MTTVTIKCVAGGDDRRGVRLPERVWDPMITAASVFGAAAVAGASPVPSGGLRLLGRLTADDAAWIAWLLERALPEPGGEVDTDYQDEEELVGVALADVWLAYGGWDTFHDELLPLFRAGLPVDVCQSQPPADGVRLSAGVAADAAMLENSTAPLAPARGVPDLRPNGAMSPDATEGRHAH